MKATRKKMKQNAKAYNKHLTDKYLDELSDDSLIALTHPLDRDGFKRELGKEVEEDD